MTALLEVAGLRVRFGEREVLRGLDFSVEAGGCLAVIGPNGSGKTVLFRALIGAVPHEGTIRWAPGTRIGYVPQQIDLERDLPLADTGLAEASAARPLGALSGGQFQRLLLAFALIGGPNVLILDEPTAGIDEPGQERLYHVHGRD